MLRRIVLAAFATGLGMAGCVSTPPTLPAYEAGIYGIASCGAEIADRCAQIAGKTALSVGPFQAEYHSPDGRTYLWVRDRLVPGYWSVKKTLTGVNICYKYAETSASNCQGLVNKGLDERTTRQGDPYALASRQAPPFDLSSITFREMRNEGWELVDRRVAQVAG